MSSVLCRHCWQWSILQERRSKRRTSRLRFYKQRHPQPATGQCPGRTWW